MNQEPQKNYSTVKSYKPFYSQYDPCPPIGRKYYSTPPQLYLGFQPMNMPQYSAKEALKKGTLWPYFYDYYDNPYKGDGR
nr:spore coat associated protein CotJA [Bacillus kexueae]